MSVNPAEPAVVIPNPSPTPSAPTADPGAQSALFQKAGGDWSKANDSYFHAVKELGSAKDALQATTQRMQQLEGFVAQHLGVGGQPNYSNDPLAPIQNELGLPIEPMRQGIRGEVQAALQELLGPVLNRHQAEEALADEIENFDQLRNQARAYMRTNPQLAETFNAVQSHDPAAAWRFAIQSTLLATGAKLPGPPSVQNAGLPGGAIGVAGRSEPNPAGVPDAVKLQEALDYGRVYGDDAPYLAERFKGTSIERAVDAALQQTGFVFGPS